MTGSEDFFPFTVMSHDTGHFIQKPYDFINTFHAHRPKDQSWYAFDVIVKSRTELEFIVYEMRDFCYGGIGKEVTRFEAKCDETVTHRVIEERLLKRARSRRARELQEAEDRIISAYMAEIREKI